MLKNLSSKSKKEQILVEEIIEFTTIAIPKSLLEKIISKKIHNREPHYEVIDRYIK